MAQVEDLYDGDGLELAPGVLARPLFGEGAMLNLIDFEPNATVPVHSHPHEQLGIVIDGRLIMHIDGVDYDLGPGGAYQIPGGVEHGAWTHDEPCRVLDVFHPVREDYRERFQGL